MSVCRWLENMNKRKKKTSIAQSRAKGYEQYTLLYTAALVQISLRSICIYSRIVAAAVAKSSKVPGRIRRMNKASRRVLFFPLSRKSLLCAESHSSPVGAPFRASRRGFRAHSPILPIVRPLARPHVRAETAASDAKHEFCQRAREYKTIHHHHHHHH